MKMEGGFTLVNWDVEVIEKISGGIFSVTTTAASPNAAIPDQVIAAGWADNTIYNIVAQTSASDSSALKLSSQPIFTAVTLDLGGTPEVLAEDTEYTVFADPNSSSGWSMSLISGAMSTGSPTTFAVTLEYDTNTPVASQTLNAGASTVILNPMEYRFKHTDENGKIRQLDLHSVDPNSGFMSFNYKGANEDGLEEIPVTYMAKLDSTLTSGQQLMSFLFEDGAQ